MNSKRHIFSIVVIAAAAMTFWASATQKKAAFKVPTYSWTPPTTEPVPNKFTIALINPRYTEYDLAMYEPFKAYASSLGMDVEELMTARGYSIRGPFPSRDDMVYADKEVCDLALLIDVEPTFKVIEGGWTTSGRCADGSTGYRLKNVIIAISGKIILQALEPLTNEKLWVKSLEIPTSTTSKINSLTYCTQNLFLFIRDDGNVQNPIIDLLQASYADILDKIWNHVNPSEFERLRPTIEDLKKSK